MNFFRRLKNNMYGFDELNYFLTMVWLVICLAGNIFRERIIISLGTLLLLYIAFRILSPNKAKRFKENQKFVAFYRGFMVKYKQAKVRRSDKTHNYYRCPNCKTYLSVPKGVGKVCIVCNKCKKQFIKISK